jgi:mannose-6-phosphate isomerase
MPLHQIASHLSSTPEFATLIPSAILDRFLSIASSVTPTGPEEKAALKDLFSALMTTDESSVKVELKRLTKRLATGDVKDTEKEIKDLILRLDEQFPGDIGVFCPFMLNYLQMEPGEAMFLGAGEPHAYVSGGMFPCPPYNSYSSDMVIFPRYYGMHGELRQCYSSWSNTETQRHPKSRLWSHLLCVRTV